MTMSSVGEHIHWEDENILRGFITYIDYFKIERLDAKQKASNHSNWCIEV